MAVWQNLAKSLRHAERELEKQLAAVRAAISSLDFGSAVSPSLPGLVRRGRPKGSKNAAPRKKRKMSRAGRKAIAEAQRKRWAAVKAAKK